MHDLGPDLSPPEYRLLIDSVFGPLNFPDSPSQRDDYISEGLRLLRSVKDQSDKVREVAGLQSSSVFLSSRENCRRSGSPGRASIIG